MEKACVHKYGKTLVEAQCLKCTEPPKCFSTKSNLLVIQSIWEKKNLNLVESSIFYALSKSRLKCCTTEF